jgi:hypothetical protein
VIGKTLAGYDGLLTGNPGAHTKAEPGRALRNTRPKTR